MGFRLDANKYVASGHMMRCVSITEEIIKSGHSVIFFLADDSNSDYLRIKRVPYKVFDGHWDNWDADIEKMTYEVKEERIDILVVDSYITTAKFLASLNRIVPVFLMDDLCSSRYDVSAVLHYSEFPGENSLKELYRDSDVKVFAGMQFAPLRQEFTRDFGNQPGKKQILITTGGTDPYHISVRLTKLLVEDDRFKDWEILVVCGRMNDDYESILAMRSGTDRLTVLKNVSNMAELMRESEIAVSAGGMTIYELCCSGTAIVGFAFSDDQVNMLERFAERGILLYSGDVRQDKGEVVGKIFVVLTDWIVDKNQRLRFVQNSSNLTDGRGVCRIAEKILEVGIEKRG